MTPVQVQAGKRRLIMFEVVIVGNVPMAVVADTKGACSVLKLSAIQVLGPAGHWPPPETLDPRKEWPR